jgi:uridine kinase
VQVDALAQHVLGSPAGLNGSRLVCIDGRAGAGKTSLAAELEAALRSARSVTTVHMDDLYAGWSGLPTVAEQVVAQLVQPWAAGRPGMLAAWDWHRSTRLDPVPVPLTPVMLLEGVGSWSRRLDGAVSTLVWLECDEQTRRTRACARDGEVFEVRWDSWAADEDVVHARELTRLHADVVIDTGAQRAVPAP